MLNVELVFSIKTGPAIESLGTEAFFNVEC